MGGQQTRDGNFPCKAIGTLPPAVGSDGSRWFKWVQVVLVGSGGSGDG